MYAFKTEPKTTTGAPFPLSQPFLRSRLDASRLAGSAWRRATTLEVNSPTQPRLRRDICQAPAEAAAASLVAGCWRRFQASEAEAAWAFSLAHLPSRNQWPRLFRGLTSA